MGIETADAAVPLDALIQGKGDDRHVLSCLRSKQWRMAPRCTWHLLVRQQFPALGGWKGSKFALKGYWRHL
jgi:hypothetical protein